MSSNMNTRTILFIPTYYYLSLPVFYQLSGINKDKSMKMCFFITDDPLLSHINNYSSELNNIRENFDEVFTIDNSDLITIKKYFNLSKSLKLVHLTLFYRELRRLKKRTENKLETIKPDIIVMTGELLVNIFCSNWAKKKNIPVVIIQPTFLSFNNRKTFVDQLKSKFLNTFSQLVIQSPVITDNNLFGCETKGNYLFLWNEKTKEKYSNRISESKIKITGNPLFDKYFNLKSKTKLDLDIKIDYSKPIITICPQNLIQHPNIIPQHKAEEINQIYKGLISYFQNIFFIVKTHPIQSEDYTFYCDYLNHDNVNNFIVTQHSNLLDLYKISTMQISFSSASSFEAILSDVPILLIMPDLLKVPEFFDNSIELTATTLKEAIDSVKMGLREDYKKTFTTKREKYIQEKVGLFNGQNSHKIFDEMKMILEV
jgi:UDP-N-acetylglucosamine 2-epimerase